MSEPCPEIVLDLIEAYRGSKAMFAATALGVFDSLESPVSLATLASGLQANPTALETLLNACVSLRLIEKTDAGYRNTATASAFLRRASPQSLAGYVLYSNSVSWKLWGNLEDAVKEGTNRWPQAFGLEGPLFSSFFRTDEAMRSFLQALHGFGQLSSPQVVRAFDLSEFQILADLGGGTGHLSIAACGAYPNLRAIVFDLPKVMDLARETAAASAVASRITCQAGDFFTDPLPQADLYAVGRILHDWGEDRIRLLLERIHAALPSGGALLIAETLLADEKTSPRSALLQSLNMLACTEGRERSAREYEALCKAAGFTQCEARITGTPVDAVLARKD